MGKLTEEKGKDGEAVPMGKPSINIYSEQHLKDIGMKELPNVGDKMNVQATVKVVSVSMSSFDGHEDSKSVSLEIEEMEVEKKKKSEKEMANSLYGKE